jgi:hypothetical protein
MNIRIKEIYSFEMFPGLIIGKPKDGMYEKSLDRIKGMLGSDPIFNLSEVKWIQFKDKGYGSWGHISGVGVSILDGYDVYDFSIIVNYYPELDSIESIIKYAIDGVNWREGSNKWDIGDL